MNDKSRKPSYLVEWCKYGDISMIREILAEEKGLDICYGEGTYFYCALDLSDESKCLEILDALLSYAEETKVSKRKLAETISDAMERVRGTIYDSAKEKLEPYLKPEDERSSEYFEADEPVGVMLHSLEESAKAAEKGDIEALIRVFDKNSNIYALRVVSLAAEKNQDGVIEAVASMMDTSDEKANIFRIAGDFYAQISLDKSAAYYTRSLELHPGCFITLSKLGALYEEFFCKSGDDILREKAIGYYNLAIPTSEHKIESICYIVTIVQSHLKILQEASAYESAKSQIVFLDELLSFSSESYHPEISLAGEIPE